MYFYFWSIPFLFVLSKIRKAAECILFFLISRSKTNRLIGKPNANTCQIPPQNTHASIFLIFVCFFFLLLDWSSVWPFYMFNISLSCKRGYFRKKFGKKWNVLNEQDFLSWLYRLNNLCNVWTGSLGTMPNNCIPETLFLNNDTSYFFKNILCPELHTSKRVKFLLLSGWIGCWQVLFAKLAIPERKIHN